MFHIKRFVHFQSLRNKIRIKFVQLFIEQSCEILWKFVRFLQTRTKSIGQSGDIRDMMVLTELWLILNTLLKISLI